ncbi:MAG TPA: hypothetical protein VHK69_07220, partial [Chitinophagaceae bacterium]|nr:hypothetical protein [Chitinophagaceae bacterium]
FFNHLALSRRTALIIRGGELEIIQRGQSHSIEIGRIQEVIQYSTRRLPWSPVVKWILKAEEGEWVISSLTISRLHFERHFWTKTKVKRMFFPLL